jgi:ATP-dependent protease ClpP protease subunit
MRDIADQELRRQLRSQMPDVVANLRAKAAEHVLDRPRREAGYTIQNSAGDEAVVRIYDEIWWLGVNALDLVADLDTISAPRIRVEINSPGGDVFDGIAIYNALRLHPAHVTTRVDGLAASIASVIAQAGDHRVMVSSSQMMIHNAWGVTMGNQADHEEMAAILGQQDEILAGIYATKSEHDAAHFLGLMNAETWLTAERAVAEGLADEILEPAKPEQAKASLLDQITALASSTVLDDVAQLVAHHGGDSLTGAKREGLVALRDRVVEILNDSPDEDPEYAAKRLAYAKRRSGFQAALPPHFVG